MIGWITRDDFRRVKAGGLKLAAFALIMFGSAHTGHALPSIQTATDTDEDATLELRLQESDLIGAPVHWCELEVEVTSNDYQVQAGDTVSIDVYEDDGAGDENLWTEDVTISASDISNGTYTETFGCHAKFKSDSDTASTWQIYAQAEVSKQSYGTFEVADTPTTSNLRVARASNDAREPDETQSKATLIADEPPTIGGPQSPRDTVPGGAIYPANDRDWFEFSIPAAAKLDIQVSHRPLSGRITVDLFRQGGQQVSMPTDKRPDGTFVEEHSVQGGTYFFRIRSNSSALNYYDLSFQSTISGDAACGQDEDDSTTIGQARTCGKCGRQTRSCERGAWGEWSECKNEDGNCVPGETRTVSCGKCGRRTDECTSECKWQEGTCENTGPCTPGDQQEQSCENGGTQVRTCKRNCEWGEFSECSGKEGRGLGEPCQSDSDCREDTCLGSPTSPRFSDGYCSVQGCSTDRDCPEGSLCAGLGSQTYCLETCNRSGGDGCDRVGYQCMAKQQNTVCVPNCEDDSHCSVGRCDTSRGRCISESGDAGPPAAEADSGTTGGPTEDTASTDVRNPDSGSGDGSDASSPPVRPEAGCGCTSTDGSPITWWFALFLVGLVRARRIFGE